MNEHDLDMILLTLQCIRCELINTKVHYICTERIPSKHNNDMIKLTLRCGNTSRKCVCITDI